MMKNVRTKELFDFVPSLLSDLFETTIFPWEILPKIGDFLLELLKNPPKGYVEIKKGILVGENVKIDPLATIKPPALIGAGCEIRPGAFLRGNVILGENCVIGNSSELKNCILLDQAQVPHYNYIGDSILGTRAHMGAGSICSNLKSDGKSVVIHGDTDYQTGLRKIGAILGDGADIGCGCVCNPGTVIGKNTSVYPLTSLRGVYPQDCIVKDTKNFIKRNK